MVDAAQNRLSGSLSRAHQNVDDAAQTLIRIIEENRRQIIKDLDNAYGAKQLQLTVIDKKVRFFPRAFLKRKGAPFAGRPWARYISSVLKEWFCSLGPGYQQFSLQNILSLFCSRVRFSSFSLYFCRLLSAFQIRLEALL